MRKAALVRIGPAEGKQKLSRERGKMRSTNRFLLTGLLFGTCILFHGTANAQYMYLDSDGDGVPTSADRVVIPGTTSLAVWLRTDLNRDGSPAPCGGGGTMTLTSYEVNLQAVNGRVRWGTFENALSATMQTFFGTTSSDTTFYVGYGGPAALSPGTYKLGTVSMFVTAGSPQISIVSDSTATTRTRFGTSCAGVHEGTATLGQEWQDADGLSAAATTVLFTEDFESSATLPSTWQTTKAAGTFTSWGISTPTCGYARGTRAASATMGEQDNYYCSRYPNGVDNAMKRVGAINASRLSTYQVSYQGLHNLVYPGVTSTDNFWQGYLVGADSSFLTATGVRPFYGAAATWQLYTGDQINNTDDNLLPGAFVKPIYGLQTYAESPFAGTYGAWLDDIQIYGTQRPDLIVSGTPSAYGSGGAGVSIVQGQAWSLKYTILNSGQLPLNSFSMNSFGVRVRLKAIVGGTIYYITTKTETGLAANTQRTTTLTALSGTIPPGQYHILLDLDDSHSVRESTPDDGPELNNVYESSGMTGTFTWVAPPAPNLIVQSAIGLSLAKTGQTVGITVTVTNTGSAADSTPFRLGFYRDRATPPPVNAVPDSFVTLTSLAIGQLGVYTFFVSSAIADTVTMYAFVDYRNDVPGEQNEGDNLSLPKTLAWRPSTIVVKGYFFFDDSLRGVNQTIPCNDVVLYEWDPATPTPIALANVSVRDLSGYYEFPPIENRDPTDNGLRDLFVRVNYRSNEACWDARWPGNWFVTMKTPQDSTWHYDSRGYTDVQGDTLNVGEALEPRVLRPSSYGNRGALHILQTIIYDGWTFIRDNFVPAGVPVTGIRVKWAPGYDVGPDYQSDSLLIRIPGVADSSRFMPDEWDDGRVLHEYGHHIANVGGFNLLVGGNHPINGASASDSLAWNEGWGHFFAALRGNRLSGDPFAAGKGQLTNYGRGPGGTLTMWTWDLERDSLYAYSPNLSTLLGSVSFIGGGPLFEGSIAGALWDAYDSADEAPFPLAGTYGDLLSDGFAPIWGVLHAARDSVYNVNRFLSAYDSVYSDPRRSSYNPIKSAQLRRIFLTHGIFASPPIPTAVLAEGGTAGPRVVMLGASPNPFNPVTRFRFICNSDRAGGNARLRIHDVQGRLVRTLKSRVVVAGRNELLWVGLTANGTDCSSGVYFCAFEYAGYEKKLKVVLLR